MPKILPKITVVVTTYNWPSALTCVLDALRAQTYRFFEVIVADDGSDAKTESCIQKHQAHFPVPLKHVWQEDKGFRAARVRNRALAKAEHPYIVFLDGDSVPLPNFLLRHAQLAQKGYFVAGNRTLFSEAFTQKVLENNIPIFSYSAWRFALSWIKGECNRLGIPWMIPLGFIRKWHPNRWRGVKTCNLGVWREDLLLVNGLDEAYEGWGYEDTDLVLRLQNSGIKCLEGRGAVSVLHLWHPQNTRDLTKDNLNRLKQAFLTKPKVVQKGINQYLHE